MWIIFAVFLFVWLCFGRSGFRGTSGRSLSLRFQKLGMLVGLTRAQITDAVGPPNAVSYLRSGELLQWIVPGYHISLVFVDNICQGVHHESAARR